MSSPLLGIIGGMGPAATVDFYSKLIAATPADRDQDHVPVVIWADPRIPDRSAALQGRGPDPTPALVHAARQVAAAGATAIAVPCNTAHAFLNTVRTHIDIPIIDMIESTVDSVAADCDSADFVGILGTSGILNARLYQQSLARRGLRSLVPRADEQARWVDPAIRAVKAGTATPSTADDLERAAGALVSRGARVIVAGCTEIPLTLAPHRVDVTLVDSTRCLAITAVRTRLGVAPR